MTLSTSALTSYVPDLVIEQLASAPTRPLEAPLDAVLLLADISGFTALSERLAHDGREGAERLSETLNATFSPIIDTIHNAGGMLAKFAGDAVLALWPGATAGTARAAMQAAQAIQQLLHAQASQSGLALRVRIGIAAGPLSAMHIGGVYNRWELLLSGAPLHAVAQAEHQAEPGEVVLAPEVVALLLEHSAAAPVGFVHHPPAGHPELEQQLRSYIPAAVLSRLDAGQPEWLAELRRISVLFINLPGLTGDTTLPQAHAALAAIQHALYRYEGSVNKIGQDDKGVAVVAAFGLPPFAHEDDPARALLAGREIGAALAELGLSSAIGVTSGQVFCGAIGNQRRREYTIIGATVNLAARLMQAAAPAQDTAAQPFTVLLCDTATAHAVGGRIGLEELPPIRVKGRTEPVTVYRALPAAPAPALATRLPVASLVGRAEEQAVFAAALERLAGGRGGVLGIEGEPGIGKSRLASELASMARARGLRLLSGAADAIERDAPYYAWRPVIAALLGIEEAADPATRRARALARLGQSPARLPRAPLLNTLLPLDLPESSLSAQLQGPARADNLHELLLWLLRQEARQTPLVLVLEDAHWFDSASWALTTLVQRALPQILLVITTRPADHPPPPLLALREASAHWLQLTPLSHADTIALLCNQLGVAALPAPLAELIRTKAEGNPFFSSELVAMLSQTGVLEIAGDTVQLARNADLRDLHIPDTVQGVIVSRIDRLRPEQQLVLKIASVIGRQFPLRLLHAIYPVPTPPAQLAALLEELRQLEITLLDAPDPERSYLFKHVITQEATYGLLLYAQRRALHQAVAEWYEQNHHDELGVYAALLAYHWRRASQIAKALDYLELAAQQSLSTAAYREATRLLNEALSLGTNTPPQRRAAWEAMLGQALLGLGQIATSRARFEQALGLLGWASGSSPPLQQLGSLGRAALKQLWNKLAPPAWTAADQDLDIQTVQILNRVGVAYYYDGDVQPLVYSVVLATLLHLHPAVMPTAAGEPLANFALLLTSMRQFGLSQYLFDSAQRIAKQLDHRPTIALNYLRYGVGRIGMGDLVGAQRALAIAIQQAAELGDPRLESEAVLFAAWVDVFCERWDSVQQRCEQLVALAERNESSIQLVWSNNLIMLTALQRGDPDKAVQSAHNNARMLEVSRPTACLSHSGLALAELARGRLEDARAALDQAMALVGHPVSSIWTDRYAYDAQARVCLAEWANAPNDPARHCAARRACLEHSRLALAFPLCAADSWQNWGRYWTQCGRPRLARLCYRRALAVATRMGLAYETGLAHAAMARSSSGPERRHHLARAIALFARMGAQHELRAAVEEARKEPRAEAHQEPRTKNQEPQPVGRQQHTDAKAQRMVFPLPLRFLAAVRSCFGR